MPRIIDFEHVLQRMEADGFRSLYHNSGSFGFSPGAGVRYAGWVGPPDASIRAEARAQLRQFAPPHAQRLARAAADVWAEHLVGAIWMMPMSHWAYELEFGSRDWMPAALREAGMDPALLSPRADGSAIQFDSNERGPFETLVERLLAGLSSSDFMLAFPGRPALCTVHHHEQLWWQTTNPALHALLMEHGSEPGPSEDG